MYRPILQAKLSDSASFDSQNLHKEVVERLWVALKPTFALVNGDDSECLCLSAYSAFYKTQCGLIALHDDGQHVNLKTHEDIMKIADELKQGKERNLIKLPSDTTVKGPERRDNSINLAARLLSMLGVGDIKHVLSFKGLQWVHGDSSSFVSEQMGGSGKLTYEKTRLPKAFDAMGLNLVGGIKIRFTDNLVNHLRLVEDMEDNYELLIFHHASFLEIQRRTSTFPPGFADETLKTLALLFPQSNYSGESRPRRHKRKRAFFDKLRRISDYLIDDRVVLCGNLDPDSRQIESFHFWRDRLVVLKQAYDDATPKTASQWWHDRRDGVRWFTFWVAIAVLIVTMFLGVSQCVESALQVYEAYHPS